MIIVHGSKGRRSDWRTWSVAVCPTKKDAAEFMRRLVQAQKELCGTMQEHKKTMPSGNGYAFYEWVGQAEALIKTSDPKISLWASANHRARVAIQITDNGRGIDEALLDKVFIPFYTTKTNGSGIGLSLSRQIMRQHKGTLSVSSTPNEKTVFKLRF